MTANHITGWDIGGAHLKVTQCDPQGKLQQVFQIPCPLWEGIEALHTAIKSALSQLPSNAQTGAAAITMTGELADCFIDRKSGVSEIISTFINYFPEDNTHIYAGSLGWLAPKQASEYWHDVASRNWQASAEFTAQHVPNGLFIDLGSTTCDIIPLQNGHATPQGVNDHQRQISRELLYTGMIRTPLIALANDAPFKGKNVGLAAELFATTADCWVLLNKLDPNTIQDNSADGKPWSPDHAARRIARLLGTDALDPSDPIWQSLALYFADKQTQLIISAIKHVIGKSSNIEINKPIIGAGIGRSIISDCAKQLGKPYIDFTSLLQTQLPSAADHAPAVAVALLAQADFQ